MIFFSIGLLVSYRFMFFFIDWKLPPPACPGTTGNPYITLYNWVVVHPLLKKNNQVVSDLPSWLTSCLDFEIISEHEELRITLRENPGLKWILGFQRSFLGSMDTWLAP